MKIPIPIEDFSKDPFRRISVLTTFISLWITVAVAHRLSDSVLIVDAVISAASVGYVFYSGSFRKDVWTSWYFLVLIMEMSLLSNFLEEPFRIIPLEFGLASIVGGALLGGVSYGVWFFFGEQKN